VIIVSWREHEDKVAVADVDIAGGVPGHPAGLTKSRALPGYDRLSSLVPPCLRSSLYPTVSPYDTVMNCREK